MNTYGVQLNIQAESPQQAHQIAQSLATLLDNLGHENIIGLGDTIQKDPKVINKFVKMLDNPLIKKLL